MPDETQSRLIGAAIAGAGREICGFVLKNWEILPVPNVAVGDHEFVMADDDLLEIYKKWGDQIAGVYHSHPKGRTGPSDVDLMFAPLGMRYWIIANHDIYEWDMDYDPPRPIT